MQNLYEKLISRSPPVKHALFGQTTFLSLDVSCGTGAFPLSVTILLLNRWAADEFISIPAAPACSRSSQHSSRKYMRQLVVHKPSVLQCPSPPPPTTTVALIGEQKYVMVYLIVDKTILLLLAEGFSHPLPPRKIPPPGHTRMVAK